MRRAAIQQLTCGGRECSVHVLEGGPGSLHKQTRHISLQSFGCVLPSWDLRRSTYWMKAKSANNDPAASCDALYSMTSAELLRTHA